MAETPHQRVVLVRHAQTEWSLSGRHTGRTDLPLLPRGRQAAVLAGRRLAGQRFARVLSSPLRRAVETARLAGFGDRLEVRQELVEWDYGELEGRTTAEIRADRPGWDLWRDGAPSGESPAQVQARVDRLVDDLDRTCAEGGDVVVFAHGHVLRAVAVRWLRLPLPIGRQLELSTGTISTLGWKREVRVVQAWNESCHLDDRGD